MSREPAPVANRKLFIKSFGCQMNVYDATRMVDTLAQEGYAETDNVEDAELVILNTCHIRERASEKVYSSLGRLSEIKTARAARGEEMVIGVAGCVAQADGAEIRRRQPAVDMILGTQSYHRLPEALGLVRQNKSAVFTDFEIDEKFDGFASPSAEKTRRRGVTAFVTIQEGCDKFCSFCVVPYTRGAEVSRSVDQLVAEIQALAANGVRDFSLLGQNVNAYHGSDENGDPVTLGKLMERLARIEGVKRLRYMTSHPCDIADDLIEAHRSNAAVMPFLHLPVQSGSDRILKAMNRKHRVADYLEAIGRFRGACPDIAISSDFIVGFPGETDRDFEETLQLVEHVGFASAYSFKFSSRPGTPAAALEDLVDEAVKAERLLRLQKLLDEQRNAYNRSFVGRTMDVLVEKPGRYDGQIAGKTPHQQAVYMDGPRELIGSIVPAEIVKQMPNSFYGRLAAGAQYAGASIAGDI